MTKRTCVRNSTRNRHKFVCHPRNSRERDGEKLISIQYRMDRMDRMYTHIGRRSVFKWTMHAGYIWDLISHCYHIFDIFSLPPFSLLFIINGYHFQMTLCHAYARSLTITKKTFRINLLIAPRRIEILRENKSGWQKEVVNFSHSHPIWFVVVSLGV